MHHPIIKYEIIENTFVLFKSIAFNVIPKTVANHIIPNIHQPLTGSIARIVHNAIGVYEPAINMYIVQ